MLGSNDLFIKKNRYEMYIKRLKEIILSKNERKYLSKMLINEWKYMSIKGAYHTVLRNG